MFYQFVVFEHQGVTWDTFITQSVRLGMHELQTKFCPFDRYESFDDVVGSIDTNKYDIPYRFPRNVFSKNTANEDKILKTKDGYTAAIIEYDQSPDGILSIQRLINLSNISQKKFAKEIKQKPDFFAKNINFIVRLSDDLMMLQCSYNHSHQVEKLLSDRIDFVLRNLTNEKLQAAFDSGKEKYIKKSPRITETNISLVYATLPTIIAPLAVFGGQRAYHLAKCEYYLPTEEDFEVVDPAILLRNFLIKKFGVLQKVEYEYCSLKYFICQALLQISVKPHADPRSDPFGPSYEDVGLNDKISSEFITRLLSKLTAVIEQKAQVEHEVKIPKADEAVVIMTMHGLFAKPISLTRLEQLGKEDKPDISAKSDYDRMFPL